MDLDEVISKKNLYSVFQPVVSLQSGEAFGYEALTRTETDVFDGTITQLFALAEVKGRLWELDKLCRKTAIKTARALGIKRKLFLNVNPGCIYATDFEQGYTQKQLVKYGIDPAEIILEITEHAEHDSGRNEFLQEAITHYREQGFKIAVDDVGSAYSGLQRVCALNPDYIKLDMSIVKGVEHDSVRQAMIKSLVSFCDSSGIGLIAEGIETANELDALLLLNVAYGQGFFLGRPDRTFIKTTSDAYVRVNAYQRNKVVLSQSAVVKTIPSKREVPSTVDGGQKAIDLCIQGITLFPDIPITEVLQLFQLHTECAMVTVVDADQKVLGIMPRALLLDLFGTQYGFSLHSKKTLRNLMVTSFLIVEADENVGAVAAKATARTEDKLYDPIVVVKNSSYEGIVTIKMLLDSIVNVEVAARTQEISKKNRILQEQQLIHDRDMHMAELVQKSFYPAKAPHTDEWDCAFVFKPMSSVSGDVYDFYYDARGKLSGTALFDVSGHGVASGLVGILSKYLAEQVFSAAQGKSLDKLLRQFNDTLTREKGMVENYLTGVFLRIKGDQLEYVNAGHTDVLIAVPTACSISKETFTQLESPVIETKFDSMTEVNVLGGSNGSFRGSFIGIEGLPDDYRTVTVTLTEGTFLVLYTDCLTESRNLAGDELGSDRLRSIIKQYLIEKSKADKSLSAKNLLAYILDVFDAFTEAVPLRDDLTVIIMKYLQK